MEVFLDKMESILEKFYKSDSSISSILSEISKIKSEINGLERENKEIKDKINELQIILESIKIKNSSNESFWGGVLDFGIKIVWILIVSYILYKLGIPGPTV